MATKQSNPYAGGAPDTTSSDTAPTGSRTATNQPRNPIAVPYYVTDPNTGLPQERDSATGRYVTVDSKGKKVYAGPDGRPTTTPFSGTAEKVRWSATVAHTSTEDDLRYRGGRPGTRQIETTSYGQVAPRYFDGDERNPASYPVDDMIMLQKYMVQIGLVKPGQGQLGVWDKTWADAYSQVLGFANSAGLDDKTALARWGDMAATNPPLNARAPLQTRTTNPDELAQIFRKTIIDTRGEGWDTEKINRMVKAFQADEIRADTAAYDQQITGGNVVQPPSAASFAETQVRKEDPLGAQEHDVIKPGGPLDAFRQMLGGWT